VTASSRLALIVEDEPAIRRFLRATLVANDYEVLEAGTAHAGLTLALSEAPDVLILDLGLPDGDGLDLLKTLRETSTVPVLVLSAPMPSPPRWPHSMPAPTTTSPSLLAPTS